MSDGVPPYFVHPTATVEDEVSIGSETRIWHHAQVRRGARIGERCILGKGAFVDSDVVVGDDCKIQNYACVYHGVTLGRGVFIGPAVVFTNDLHPRATDPSFTLLRDGDWEVGVTVVDDGAAIGANSTILPNVRIGKWALVGAASVVTRDVPPYALAVGSPARVVGWVCRCGVKVESPRCERCGELPEDHPLHSTSAVR
ncbi:MAG TPA: acyltransferase [Candidatus Elarobacter sp.]